MTSWGSGQQLSAMETLMWRAEVEPSLRSTVVAVEVLDSEPDWQRLVAAHEWAAQAVPRFNDRVCDELGPLATPVWETVERLDLSHHLRRRALTSDESIFDVAAEMAMTPFDRSRPVWEALLVSGLSGGRSAYVLKLHHALTDGMGLAQLLSRVHARGPEHDPAKPTAEGPQPETGTPSVAQRVVRQLTGDAGALGHGARVGTARGLRALATPKAAAKGVLGYLGSAQRVLSPPDVPGLPLLAARGGDWRFIAVDADLAAFKAASRNAGGTVNDGFLAALLGAFRIYHERRGTPLAADGTMSVSVPVSVRRASDAEGGNRIAPARLAGPVGEADVAARISQVGILMTAARSEPALESVELLAPVLARMPSHVVVRAATSMAASDLQASNVPGIRDEVFLAGSRIERIYGFAPLPGCAAMISMASHGHHLCVGANLDSAAIDDPGLFAESLVAGFNEVLALEAGASLARRVE